jgi:dihydropteroate synthase
VSKFVLDLPRHKLDLSSKIHISGIINVTPDSFSDGGLYFNREQAIDRAHEIVEEGADIVDIGGESTKPGSDSLSANGELKRVMPVIEKLDLDVPISIDTYKAEVAREALSAGCEIVNDISGLRFDPDMPIVIKEFDAGCIVMHIKGTPKDMQTNPKYDDVMAEIITYLKKSIEIAKSVGVSEEKIVVDPGIGFGKRNPSDNLLILKKLADLKILGRPIHIGVSRKSFIGKSLGLPLEERLEPSIASGILASLNGAKILRVHDVKATVKAIRMVEAIQKA